MIFSISMMASSTTPPRAITKPANTMVFTEAPLRNITNPPARSDKGMATAATKAARTSKRNAISIAITKMHPSKSAWVKFLIESSIKVAGRKILVSISTPGNPGCMAANAASTPRVTSSVLPQGNFSTMSISPGPSLMTASPIMSGGEYRMSATLPNGILPLEVLIGTCAKVSGVCPDEVCNTSIR